MLFLLAAFTHHGVFAILHRAHRPPGPHAGHPGAPPPAASAWMRASCIDMAVTRAIGPELSPHLFLTAQGEGELTV